SGASAGQFERQLCYGLKFLITPEIHLKMQSGTQLSCEWTRACAGYDIVPPLKRWEGWAKLGQQAQPGRGSFPAREEKWSHRVKACKGDVQAYRPLDDAGLYRRFAKLEFEPAAYRDFADKFGLLIAGDSMTLW